ncbi:rCG58378, isoform CRA_a [Rattus norvegicus]|uniref:RCG58378, isoform CRA_a n=1 Tax=Rattus norvegicus TaxID=10116 RepID=A6J565_RAT|nr:rCG58378, isoform CRA_a [Rattus norvegicus]
MSAGFDRSTPVLKATQAVHGILKIRSKL